MSTEDSSGTDTRLRAWLKRLKERVHSSKLLRWLKGLIDEPGEAAVVFVVAGGAVALLGYVLLHGWGSLAIWTGDFYANLATELISIGVTVLIIDGLNTRRSALEEKQHIIRQLGSLAMSSRLRQCGCVESGVGLKMAR